MNADDWKPIEAIDTKTGKVFPVDGKFVALPGSELTTQALVIEVKNGRIVSAKRFHEKEPQFVQVRRVVDVLVKGHA